MMSVQGTEKMKLTIRSILFLMLVSFSGCSLISSSPSSVVKKLISAADANDVETMVSLWGKTSEQKYGAAKIRENCTSFAAMVQKVKAAGKSPTINDLRETIQGDKARVFFIYGDRSKNDTVGMGFALIKENNKWTLFRSIDIGEEEQPFDSSFTAQEKGKTEPSPDPESTPIEMISPPPLPGSSNNQSPAKSSQRTISGGVLNSRATSLPKPAYPPGARAVKASGTVIVQVTIDEDGNVISATAITGHPLLRAAAVSAARQAKFLPAIVGGQHVKVNGTITYEFSDN
jgi:TonB family protein